MKRLLLVVAGFLMVATLLSTVYVVFVPKAYAAYGCAGCYCCDEAIRQNYEDDWNSALEIRAAALADVAYHNGQLAVIEQNRNDELAINAQACQTCGAPPGIFLHTTHLEQNTDTNTKYDEERDERIVLRDCSQDEVDFATTEASTAYWNMVAVALHIENYGGYEGHGCMGEQKHQCIHHTA